MGNRAGLSGKVQQPKGFRPLMQTFKADAYHSDRMRLAVIVRTENAADWCGLWMRVDGSNKEVLVFDNMRERPIQGTTDWQEYAVVLDVAPEAITVAFEEVDAAALITAARIGT